MSQWTDSQLSPIANVLMAAAGADHETLSSETSVVRKILKELCGGKILPELDTQVRVFDAKRFDLAATVSELGALEEAQRRALLALVSQVTESDEVHDLEESDFIVRLAKAIGASPDEYAGLTVELVSSQPPPVPPKR